MLQEQASVSKPIDSKSPKHTMTKAVKGITCTAWFLLALTNVTLLLGMQGLPVCVQFPLLGLALVALAWLLIRYNRPLAQWRAAGLLWLAYSLLRLSSVWLHSSEFGFLKDNMANFAMLLATEAMLSGWFALFMLAIRRDVSLAYLVIFFVLGGPLLRAVVMDAGSVLEFLFGPESEDPLLYFSVSEPLIMSLSCMITIGFVAFLPHLAYLLGKELRG